MMKRDLPRVQPGRALQGGPEALRSSLGTRSAEDARRSRLGCRSAPGEPRGQVLLHAGQPYWQERRGGKSGSLPCL